MDLVSGTGVASGFTARPRRSAALGPRRPSSLLFPKCPRLSLHAQRTSLVARAKKRGSVAQPILDEEGGGEGGRDDYAEDFGDEILVDDDEAFEDEFEMDDAKLYVGDGGEGGGISLAGTSWDKKALSLAEKVSMSFDGDLKIYAFKTTVNSTIRVRIEKLSSKYGSPSMTDIEAFSSAYQELLDEAGLAGTIPENLSLEVSSPGVERVVRIPEELERFKEKPMKVRYTINNAASDSPQESEGIYKLISFDLDSQNCTWGIADVKANRKQAGKGRPLTKKQREWRLQTPFDSLILVRIHSDC
ncbi:uncharacterized protein LOC109824710 [Asparagus officinalis]|uniref:uncharacterized protein LOC109824710 n=1 Tax=Asparagus officinalis TaxID=4686 RepID=UPI00098E6142|nr:uncharacterized protein LOC109824710 [Asparagus officinalis]